MAFKKGNTIWKEGLKAKTDNKERMNRFLSIAASGGLTEYANKLDKLSRGKELSKAELVFMSKIENLLPYVTPKLSQSDSTVSVQVTHSIEKLALQAKEKREVIEGSTL